MLAQECLYRYCREIVNFPLNVCWRIFHLNNDGSTGDLLRQVDHDMVVPRKYIVLDEDSGSLDINVTSDRAPRRVYSRPPSSDHINQDSHFRNVLRERDRKYAISGKSLRAKNRPFLGLSSTHVYSVSRINEWKTQNYRRWIADTSSPREVGNSRIFSPQNGLLLMAGIDMIWDAWRIGIDPDEGFKIICFGEDAVMLGGCRLAESAITRPTLTIVLALTFCDGISACVFWRL
ncbi:HNH endonuclease signature motif containing protein [Aspergillus glaucus CBS 516.65]|uniref:HNH nuclease domain-containing protein n=1 Tax=Aspergillus glaucus CBS 516.65 TaxID=1160497 RepID=A0A1L9W097_ASPGL|nr:hypothetical protein ASPGLDRAFT_268507 [Aspergillus glaucus CBS 516.65]OJJ89600.1 hypothetical protein ASPGLDRAFT_268507 [Aspergillus glaucus CBS 516.65]